jgi:hypothetical protein
MDCPFEGQAEATVLRDVQGELIEEGPEIVASGIGPALEDRPAVCLEGGGAIHDRAGVVATCARSTPNAGFLSRRSGELLS